MDICNSSFLSAGKYLHNSSNLQSSQLYQSINCEEIFSFYKYNFTIFLHNNKTIQIKVINTLNMDHYSDLIDDSFIEDKKYITTIKILYFIIRDSLQKKNETITSISYKTTNDKYIQFNILYKTHYNTFIIPLCIPIEIIDSNTKDKLLIKKLILDNITLKEQLDDQEIRLSKIENKFIV